MGVVGQVARGRLSRRPLVGQSIASQNFAAILCELVEIAIGTASWEIKRHAT